MINEYQPFHVVLIPRSLGYPIPVLERRRFLEIMYNGLEDKSVVRTQAEVVDIIDSPTSVKVLLADGTCEEGDLVLGVDGVHSRIRNMMWRNANAAVPGTISTKEKKSECRRWDSSFSFFLFSFFFVLAFA